MEGAEISLALHVHVLHPPLDIVLIGQVVGDTVVAHRMSEVIERKVVHLELIATSVNAELFRRGNVIELAVVAGCHRFKAIPDEVAVKLLQ